MMGTFPQDLSMICATAASTSPKRRQRPNLPLDVPDLHLDEDAIDTASPERRKSIIRVHEKVHQRELMSKTLHQREHPLLAKVVTSEVVEVAMAVLIILNCVTMGIEAQTMLGHSQGWKSFLAVSEHVFTTIYVLELSVRLYVVGWRSFVPLTGDPLNCLDAAIVLVTGVVAVWILPLFGTGSRSMLRVVSILRVCRLVRLLRVVAKVKMFQEVWQLLQGLVQSMRTLFWTIVVIFFITYIFSVIGVVLISTELKARFDTQEGSVDPELEALMPYTDSIWSMMQTLIQVLTLDSWSGIMRPLCNYVGWSWAFFYAYITIAVIVLLNLVTAVMVDNAMKNSQKEEQQLLELKEKEKKKHLEQFRSLFELMDLDGSGTLTWSEFESAFEVTEVANKLRLLDFEPKDCRELFALLDQGNGELSLEEFYEGISNMDGTAKAKDSFKLLKLAETLQRSLQQLAHDVQEDNIDLLEYRPEAAVHTRIGSLRSRARPNITGSSLVSPPKSSSPSPRKVSVMEPGLPPTANGGSTPTGVNGGSTPTGKFVFPRPLQRSVSSGNSASLAGSPLKRLDEVSAQVFACNDKVDILANSMCFLQASMERVLQKLECEGAPPSATYNAFDPHCEMTRAWTRQHSDIPLERTAMPSDPTLDLPPSSAQPQCSLPCLLPQQRQTLQASARYPPLRPLDTGKDPQKAEWQQQAELQKHELHNLDAKESL